MMSYDGKIKNVNINHYIYYESCGLHVPFKVKSYNINSGICMFYNFPLVSKKSFKGKIILYTGIGKIKKTIRFKRYDEQYKSVEEKDAIISYKNSIK